MDDFADGFAHAETGGLRRVGEALDPTPATDVKAQATEVGLGAAGCSVPLPGCQAYIAKVDEVTGLIAEFAATVEEGFRTYTALATNGAETYEVHDGIGAALVMGAGVAGQPIGG